MLTRRRELEESESSLTSKPSSAVHNRLSASALTTLLDARKEVKTAGEMRKLYDDFNCDEGTVQRLTRYVTSPSLSLQRDAQHEKDDTYLVSQDRTCNDLPADDRDAGPLGRSGTASRAHRAVTMIRHVGTALLQGRDARGGFRKGPISVEV